MTDEQKKHMDRAMVKNLKQFPPEELAVNVLFLAKCYDALNDVMESPAFTLLMGQILTDTKNKLEPDHQEIVSRTAKDIADFRDRVLSETN